MSLILDALNRSQQERSSNAEVPGIATQHYPDTTPQRRNWRTGVPWLALILALVAIAYLLLRGEDHAVPVAAVTSSTLPLDSVAIGSTGDSLAPDVAAASFQVESVEDAGQERSAPARPLVEKPEAVLAAAPEAGKPAITDSSSNAVLALYAGAGDAGKQPAGDAPVASDTLAGASSAVQADRTQARKDTAGETTGEATGETTGETTESVDIEALLAQAAREVDNNRLAEHQAPFLEQLSQQKKDQIPTLMYSRHDYSSQASQSRVLINGKMLKVGDTAAAGVRLDEILSDSSVFSFRGDQFRLSALNSWVNL
jgi:hypothetical protein